jgi:hypothetical protein
MGTGWYVLTRADEDFLDRFAIAVLAKTEKGGDEWLRPAHLGCRRGHRLFDNIFKKMVKHVMLETQPARSVWRKAQRGHSLRFKEYRLTIYGRREVAKIRERRRLDGCTTATGSAVSQAKGSLSLV